MDLCLAILLVIYIITIIISVTLDKKLIDLNKKILNLNDELLKEKGQIVGIIISDEINNEQSYFTLEKIKNVLVNNRKTDN